MGDNELQVLSLRECKRLRIRIEDPMVLSRHKILLSFRANVTKEQTKYLSVIFKNDVFLPTDELNFFYHVLYRYYFKCISSKMN